MADRSITVTLKAEIAKYLADLRKAGKGTADLSKAIDAAGTRSAQAFASLPAAAAGASAATAAALGGVSAAFIGMGAVALRNNTEVRQSFEDLSNTINTGIAQDAAPLADAFVGAAEDIGAAYQQMRPQLQQAFQASVPYVEDLTASVTGFAQNAMPGLVDAVQSAGPVFDGLRSLMLDAGTATGEFFSILSEHSAEAGAGMEHFGAIVAGVVPNVAEIVGTLTDVWAEHGDLVAKVLTQLSSIIADVAGTSLPGLADAVGVALSALSGILDVIAPIADEIGPLIGLWISLATAMKGIRVAKSVLDRVGVSVADFGKKMRTTSGKVKVGAGVIVGGLALIGQAMTGTFEQNYNVDELTTSLKKWGETGKATGEAAKLMSGDVYDLSTAFDDLGSPLRGLTDPLAHLAEMFGASTYITAATDKVKALDKALAKMVESGNSEAANAAFKRLSAMANKAGLSTDELLAMLPKYTAAQKKAAAATRSSGDALLGAKPGADALTEAMKTLGDQTATTADHVDALNTAWRQLFGITIGLEEATANWMGGLSSLSETIASTQQSTNNWRNALITAEGRVNLNTEAGRRLSEQLIAQGEDYRTLAQTVYDTTLKRTGSEQQATAAVVAATRKRRAQFVDEMIQMGVNAETAQKLANRYLGLPDDVLTLIKADASGAQSEVNQFVRYNDGRVIWTTIAIKYRGYRNLDRPQVGLAPGIATGGLISHGRVQRFPTGGMVTGPGGPRDDAIPAWVSNGEFVVNAAATDKHLPLLRAINAGKFASGGMVGGGMSSSPLASGSVVVRFDMSGADGEFKQMIRKMTRVYGRGDVQVAFGS